MHRMVRKVLVAGGGIGGLAAALACARAGCDVQVFERAGVFAEVGAGLQIGPNITRVLQAWGLGDALAGVAAFPSHLQVRDAATGRELGVLRLSDRARQRYGAPYATLHRADLHQLLLDAVRQQAGSGLLLSCTIHGFAQSDASVAAHTDGGHQVEGDILLGADGLWSAVRQCLLGDGPPRVTGHLAYRALVPQHDLPASLRSQHITVWLGPDLHLVQYPVRGGAWLNVVGIVHQRASAALGAAQASPASDADDGTDAARWDQRTTASRLRAALVGSSAPLQDLVQAVADWRCWTLCDRAPVSGPGQMAQGRVALLGDAAHPMRPYLAQGAGMAIEDAATLGRMLAAFPASAVEAALRAYADQRWQRNARVQARALRNGRIFHARGPLRWARDIALRMLGERVLDVPWLYRY